MSYFAAAVCRESGSWTATELDLSEVADLEDVAEMLRDVCGDTQIALLFVESDDSYLVILRLDEGEDIRIFCSDGTFAEDSRLGALLLGEIEEPALDLDDDEEGATGGADGGDIDLDEVDEVPAGNIQARGVTTIVDLDPVGDPDLLSDLGVSAHKLLELCRHERMLPSDVTAEICQLLGCGDEIEELREA